MIFEKQHDDFVVSTDKRRLNLRMIHDFLANRSYWAKGIPLKTVKKAVRGSLCFGVYKGDTQVGFARIISDGATFAYLADVFIIEDFRGKGLSKFLVKSIVQHPDLQGFRRWLLFTQDAHELYTQVGFSLLENPQWGMEIVKKDIYLSSKS